MFRARIVFSVFFLLIFAAVCWDSRTSIGCQLNLDDGRQIAIRYNPVTTKKERVPVAKPWEPGGAPMTLFTDASLSFGQPFLPVRIPFIRSLEKRGPWRSINM